MRQNQRWVLIGLALAMLALFGGRLAVAKRAENSKNQMTAIIQLPDKLFSKPAPIAIRHIRINGQDIEPGTPFLASADWFTGLSVEVENTSSAPLVQVSVGVEFEELIPEQSLSAGRDHWHFSKPPAGEQGLRLEPGQTVTVQWSAAYVEWLKKKITEIPNLGAVVSLSPTIAINEDGETGWFYGDEGYRYRDIEPDKPGLWLYNWVDYTDPRYQAHLQNLGKEREARPQTVTRYDEGSNSIVLDSGVCVRRHGYVMGLSCTIFGCSGYPFPGCSYDKPDLFEENSQYAKLQVLKSIQCKDTNRNPCTGCTVSEYDLGTQTCPGF